MWLIDIMDRTPRMPRDFPGASYQPFNLPQTNREETQDHLQQNALVAQYFSATSQMPHPHSITSLLQTQNSVETFRSIPSLHSETQSLTRSMTIASEQAGNLRPQIPFEQLFTVEKEGLRLTNGELIPQNKEQNCYDWLSEVRVTASSALSQPSLDLNKPASEGEDDNAGASDPDMEDKANASGNRKGKACARQGCDSGAAPPTNFCISHGGGRRCEYQDCEKAKRAPSKFCRRHGGGKRCQKPECEKAAISAYDFCARHGGGKRCVVPDCGKYAEPPTDRCKGHGGGPRCEVQYCTRSARRPTKFCSAHGGGKRCEVEGCGKASVKDGKCWSHGGKELRKKAKEEREQAAKNRALSER